MNSQERKALIIQNRSQDAAVLSNFLHEIGITSIKPVFINFGLIEMIVGHRINLVLTDLELIGEDGSYTGNGCEICQEIKTFCNNIKVLFISSESEELMKDIAVSFGADAYITRPCTVSKLESCLRELGFN